ncbi:MAG: TIR domain-containing protein [Candidatus Nitrosopolaris sp.]
MTRLFISYSSKDLQLAEEIEDSLKKEGFDIWRDKREIETDWSKEIANALTSSDIILVIWTKNASNSSYVKNEWLTARALGKLIKPILFSKDKLNEELPQPLRNLQAVVDFQETENIQNSIQKLIGSLKKVISFTCDYDYNILPIKRDIPFLPNADFVGRDEDLLNLYLEMIGGLNKLSYQQVGLVGMPGVGKTQLAAEFAYRYAYQFEKGVYWIQGADTTTWLKQLVDIARNKLELKIQDNHISDQDEKYFSKLKNYCNEFGKQMLLVIDNVNEANSLEKDDILLPNNPSANYNLLNMGCNILFTTRKNFELSTQGVIQYNVDVLLPSSSYVLITKYRKPSSKQEEQYVHNICSRAGYLPLALVLVQAFLKKNTHISFKLYDEELAKKRLDSIDIGKIPKEQLVTHHISAVRATFDETWNTFERKELEVQVNQDARKMLYLLSLFGESAIIPKARLAIFSGIGKLAQSPLVVPTEEAFQLLDELNLIDLLEDGKSVRTHPILREYTLERLQQHNNEYKAADLKLGSIMSLKKTYYDDLSGLIKEYSERDGDIDSIIEDFRAALLWSEDLTRTKDNRTSRLEPIYQLKKVLEQESHNLRLQQMNRLLMMSCSLSAFIFAPLI